VEREREERKKSEGPQGEYGARRPSGGRTPACSKAEEIAAFRQGQSRSSFLLASMLVHRRCSSRMVVISDDAFLQLIVPDAAGINRDDYSVIEKN